MKTAGRYFRLQLKRYFRLLPVVLILSALMISITGVTLYGILSQQTDDEMNSLVNIGVVGDYEDTYFNMAINALSDFDSSRFSVKIKTIDDEKSASDMLRRGDIAAYVVFPDDFIRRAIHGDFQKVTCVTASGATDFGTQVTNELMKIAMELVVNFQKTVYGFQQAAADNGLDDKTVHDLGKDVALESVRIIMDRESAYEITEIGTSGEDSIKDSLISGVIILLLMLWGITCCTIFSSKNRPLRSLMSSKGFGAAKQVLCEYTAYLTLMIVTLAFFSLLVVLISKLLPLSMITDQFDYSLILPGILLPVIAISAIQFFLYEIAGGTVPGILLQFFFALSTGYICGCIYPSYMFPKALQKITRFLPAWSCRIYLDELLSGRTSLMTVAFIAAFLIAFILLSVLVRQINIKRKAGVL